MSIHFYHTLEVQTQGIRFQNISKDWNMFLYSLIPKCQMIDLKEIWGFLFETLTDWNLFEAPAEQDLRISVFCLTGHNWGETIFTRETESIIGFQ